MTEVQPTSPATPPPDASAARIAHRDQKRLERAEKKALRNEARYASEQFFQENIKQHLPLSFLRFARMYLEPVMSIVRSERIFHAMRKNGVSTATGEFARAAATGALNKDVITQAKNTSTARLTMQEFATNKKVDRIQDLSEKEVASLEPVVKAITTRIIGKNLSAEAIQQELQAIFQETGKPSATNLATSEMAQGLQAISTELQRLVVNGIIPKGNSDQTEAFIKGQLIGTDLKGMGRMQAERFGLQILQYAKNPAFAVLGLTMFANPFLALGAGAVIMGIIHYRKLRLERVVRTIDKSRGTLAPSHMDTKLLTRLFSSMSVDWNKQDASTGLLGTKGEMMRAVVVRTAVGTAFSAGFYFLGDYFHGHTDTISHGIQGLGKLPGSAGGQLEHLAGNTIKHFGHAGKSGDVPTHGTHLLQTSEYQEKVGRDLGSNNLGGAISDQAHVVGNKIASIFDRGATITHGVPIHHEIPQPTTTEAPVQWDDFIKHHGVDQSIFHDPNKFSTLQGAQHNADWAYDVTNKWDANSMTFTIYDHADKINVFALHVPSTIPGGPDKVLLVDVRNLSVADHASGVIHNPDGSTTFTFAKDGKDNFTIVGDGGPKQAITSGNLWNLFNTAGHLPNSGESSDFSYVTQGNIRGLIEFGHAEIGKTNNLESFVRYGRVQGHGGFGDLGDTKIPDTRTMSVQNPGGPEPYHGIAAVGDNATDHVWDAVQFAQDHPQAAAIVALPYLALSTYGFLVGRSHNTTSRWPFLAKGPHPGLSDAVVLSAIPLSFWNGYGIALGAGWALGRMTTRGKKQTASKAVTRSSTTPASPPIPGSGSTAVLPGTSSKQSGAPDPAQSVSSSAVPEVVSHQTDSMLPAESAEAIDRLVRLEEYVAFQEELGEAVESKNSEKMNQFLVAHGLEPLKADEPITDLKPEEEYAAMIIKKIEDERTHKPLPLQEKYSELKALAENPDAEPAGREEVARELFAAFVEDMFPSQAREILEPEDSTLKRAIFGLFQEVANYNFAIQKNDAKMMFESRNKLTEYYGKLRIQFKDLLKDDRQLIEILRYAEEPKRSTVGLYEREVFMDAILQKLEGFSTEVAPTGVISPPTAKPEPEISAIKTSQAVLDDVQFVPEGGSAVSEGSVQEVIAMSPNSGVSQAFLDTLTANERKALESLQRKKNIYIDDTLLSEVLKPYWEEEGKGASSMTFGMLYTMKASVPLVVSQEDKDDNTREMEAHRTELRKDFLEAVRYVLPGVDVHSKAFGALYDALELYRDADALYKAFLYRLQHRLQTTSDRKGNSADYDAIPLHVVLPSEKLFRRYLHERYEMEVVSEEWLQKRRIALSLIDNAPDEYNQALMEIFTDLEKIRISEIPTQPLPTVSNEEKQSIDSSADS